MEQTEIEKLFLEILKLTELEYSFIREYGDNWKAEESHLEGWWFDTNSISYRLCGLFNNHAEGYNWRIDEDEPINSLLVYILKSHGFEITHNSGDEDDAFFRMERKNQSLSLPSKEEKERGEEITDFGKDGVKVTCKSCGTVLRTIK